MSETPNSRPAIEATPGFEHLNRYWDKVNETYAVKLLPGEYYATSQDEMITTVLGSCVSACITDRISGIGGMNHFMLPEQDKGSSGAWEHTSVNAATRYGAHAMEHLINDVLKLGARRDRLTVKLFGGGQVLRVRSDVGRRNAAFAIAYVHQEHMALAAMDVEGPHPRKVRFYPRTGRVMVKKLAPLHNDTILQREDRYRETLLANSSPADIELFD